MEFMASLPPDKNVVLVGHSFGGLVISKAMETFPEMISVAAINATIAQLDNRITYDNGPINPPTTLILGLNYLATCVYKLSRIKDLALATTLVRPFYLYSGEDVSKEIVLSSKRYGSVRRVFIVATENEALKKEFQRLMIEKNPPDEVEEIEGSDHMTMISKPQQLFTTLVSIANKYS
ncbi:hypothetical protein MTR67_006352 [Solanum verrucosum]|uniref:AB hydrolase-1 domain-containing protein n=1 Tax=Solanum verrucosum TaxID=315347 RepID=A0AAF0T9M1_SOLVR|nr:hypothetical protein MTR67_006352 [Solanum verrucosum]